jgi:hypothetical protein
MLLSSFGAMLTLKEEDNLQRRRVVEIFEEGLDEGSRVLGSVVDIFNDFSVQLAVSSD